MEVMGFKIDNEEVIAQAERKNNAMGHTVWTLQKARALQPVQTGPNQVGLSFVPYLNSQIDGVFTVDSNQITCTWEPTTDIIGAYNQQTSPFELPPAKSILMG